MEEREDRQTHTERGGETEGETEKAGCGWVYLLDLDFPLLQERNRPHDEVRLDSIRRRTAHHQSKRAYRLSQSLF